MKTLMEYAGKKRKEKYNVNEPIAKYWGTLNLHGTKNIIKRSDGSISKDKTRGWHSRTVQKEALRQANRAINKRARQILKRNLSNEME